MTPMQARMLQAEHQRRHPIYVFMDLIHRMMTGKALFVEQARSKPNAKPVVEPTLLDALVGTEAGRRHLEGRGWVKMES